MSTSIKPYYSPVLPPSSLPGSLGGMAPLSSRSSEGGGVDSDSFSNTGGLDSPRADMVEQPSSSSPRPSLLRNLDCWISIEIHIVQAVLAAGGNDGDKVGAAPRNDEEDKHDLGDGAPPEWALLLVMTEAYARILRLANRRWRLDGGQRGLQRTQAKPGGLADHHDDYGAGAALFPCGDIYALLAAVRAPNWGGPKGSHRASFLLRGWASAHTGAGAAGCRFLGALPQRRRHARWQPRCRRARRSWRRLGSDADGRGRLHFGCGVQPVYEVLPCKPVHHARAHDLCIGACQGNVFYMQERALYSSDLPR